MSTKFSKKHLRMIVMSDMHCGHEMGLMPPKYHEEKFQRDFWNWFTSTVDSMKPYDICVHNGDAVEGPGKKQTIEHRTTNMTKQIKMAAECLRYTKAKEFYLTYGTPYHVQGSMEYEVGLAEKLDAVIQAKLKLDLLGHIFDLKHETSKTSIPHGQGTLIARRLLWMLIKHATENKAKSSFLIRSHVHEYICVDNRMGCGITTPGLQLGDTSYGRKFDGWYDVGLLVFDITPKEVDFKKCIYELVSKENVIRAGV